MVSGNGEGREIEIQILEGWIWYGERRTTDKVTIRILFQFEYCEGGKKCVEGKSEGRKERVRSQDSGQRGISGISGGDGEWRRSKELEA